ncbi:putative nucleic acid-binding Zn-ribbon protein [Croceifilum oryzae]|uniref:Nucleic acid-binding Zn-ribbon protein n=1 Tax=Croceifilum oryzae TaxID=1553429 RepID=A0AAJ1WU78_9BACL|nr:zinc ribbon domain-containing protein [Croceifilum oryzae]MDQ0417731.1 putative nucleic acid-binding Zn-ribbon protein [Croceifilum oryzae]
MSSFLQDIKQKIGKGVEQVSKSSQRMLEVNRLNQKLNGKKQELGQLMGQLGQYTLQQWEQTQTIQMNSELEAQFQKATAMKEEMKSIENMIQSLKEETNQTRTDYIQHMPNQAPQAGQMPMAPMSMAVVYICPSCAHQIPNQSNQCSTCGQRFY